MTPEAIARLGLDVSGLKRDAAEATAIYDKLVASVEKLEGIKAKPGSLTDLTNKNRELIAVNQQLQSSYDALVKRVDELSKKQSDTSGPKKQLDAFQQLNKEYKEAVINANKLGAELTTDSEEFQKAAAKAEMLRQKIADIKAATAAGGSLAPQIEFTTNLDQINAENERIANASGTTVNAEQLEQLKEQQEATTAAEQEYLDTIRQEGEVVQQNTTFEEQELNVLQQISLAYVSIQDQLNGVNIALKNNQTAFDGGNIGQKQYQETLTLLTAEQAELKTALADVRGELTFQAKSALDAKGAYQLLNEQYVLAKKNALDLGAGLNKNSASYERDAAAAKEAADEAKALSIQLKELDASVGVNTREVGSYESAISRSIGRLTSLDSVVGKLITNFGRTAIHFLAFNVIFAGLQLAIEAVTAALSKQSNVFDAVSESNRAYNSVIADTQKNAEKEIINLKIQEQAITNVNLPMAVRLQAVQDIKKEYPGYLSNITDEAFLSGQAAGQIDLLSKALFQKAFAEAAANKAAELGIKNLDLQGRARFLVNEQTKAVKELDEAQKQVNATIGTGGSSAVAGAAGTFSTRLSDSQGHLEDINDLLQKNRLEQRANNVEIQRYIDAAAGFQGVVQSLDPKGQAGKNIIEFKDYLQQLLKASRTAKACSCRMKSSFARQ